MSDCTHTPRLDAYYDGELAPHESQDLERHLSGCGVCTQELGALRELSEVLKHERPNPLSAAELRRIHDAVDSIQSRSLFRFAASMAAIAASVLIVSMAWMAEAPRPAAPIADNVQVMPEWERLAELQQPDTVFPDNSETGMADARDTTNWMLKGIEQRSQP